MPMSASCARSWTLAPAVALAMASLAAGTSAQPPGETEALLGKVGARIAEFYKRAQSLVCTEKVTAQPVGSDRSPSGFGRVLEYELRIEADATDGEAPSDARVVRELLKVNGRKPRAQESKTNDSCLDPNPLSPEPLSFLLPGQRDAYLFKWIGPGKGKDKNAFILEYRPRETSKAEFLEDREGRSDCFQISLPAERTGRLWIDAGTFDVLRLEQHLTAPVDIRVPFVQQRRRHLPDSLVVDRFDWTIEYKPVSFTNPAEIILLPDTIQQLVLMRGAQSHYRRQVFTNYRRFLTAGRVVK
jgi:hypothetical protein